MSPQTITSRQHPFVQRCRQVAAGRGEVGDVLLDGIHLVEDAMAAGLAIVGAVADQRGRGLIERLEAAHVAAYLAPAAVLDAASPVRAPSGVVAIARWAPVSADRLFGLDRPVLLGLVGVQDPGNVGNIIRSAEAFGASGVLVLDGSADPTGWKVLRGAMGSTFRLPVATGEGRAILSMAHAKGVRIVATVAAGGVPLDENAIDAPALVLIGSEGSGLPADLVAAADVSVTLPMAAPVNSLNAATTAAIVLWELMRSRRHTSRRQA